MLCVNQHQQSTAQAVSMCEADKAH